jgi:hypothetical protein
VSETGGVNGQGGDSARVSFTMALMN